MRKVLKCHKTYIVILFSSRKEEQNVCIMINQFLKQESVGYLENTKLSLYLNRVTALCFLKKLVFSYLSVT